MSVWVVGVKASNNGLEKANRSPKDNFTMYVKSGSAQFPKNRESHQSLVIEGKDRDLKGQEKSYSLTD